MSKKVLIIDDSFLQRKLISTAVEELGYEAVIAENGKIGLQKYSEDNFFCITLDLLMPEMDGIELLEKLKSLDNKSPVIVMSSNIQEPIRQQCFDLGAFRFLNKPFKKEKFQEILQSIEIL